jgi:hypothetical protein
MTHQHTSLAKPASALRSPYSPPPDVFLLNPNNRHFLQGMRHFPITFNANFVGTVCLLLVLLISAISLIKAMDGLSIASELRNSKITAQGEITGHRRGSAGPMNPGILYYVTYRFSSDGSAYTNEQFVGKDAFEQLSDGSSVTVKYVASNPSVSSLMGQPDSRNLTDFILAVLGGLGLVGSIVYLVPLLRRLWDEMRLRQNAVLQAGHILACHRYVAASATSINPRKFGAALSNNFYIEVSYSFHTAAGKELRGSAIQKRTDLANVKLPGFGTPVAILYLDEKHYTIL